MGGDSGRLREIATAPVNGSGTTGRVPFFPSFRARSGSGPSRWGKTSRRTSHFQLPRQSRICCSSRQRDYFPADEFGDGTITYEGDGVILKIEFVGGYVTSIDESPSPSGPGMRSCQIFVRH